MGPRDLWAYARGLAGLVGCHVSSLAEPVWFESGMNIYIHEYIYIYVHVHAHACV